MSEPKPLADEDTEAAFSLASRWEDGTRKFCLHLRATIDARTEERDAAKAAVKRWEDRYAERRRLQKLTAKSRAKMHKKLCKAQGKYRVQKGVTKKEEKRRKIAERRCAELMAKLDEEGIYRAAFEMAAIARKPREERTPAMTVAELKDRLDGVPDHTLVVQYALGHTYLPICASDKEEKAEEFASGHICEPGFGEPEDGDPKVIDVLVFG